MMQFDTSGFGKFGVQRKHLDGEGHLVDDALAGRLPFRPQFEIVRGVVNAVSVFVVDFFAFTKRPPQLLAHDNSVFEILLPASQVHTNVACRMQVPLFGDRAPFSAFVTAFTRAETLLHDVVRMFLVLGNEQATFCKLTAEFALKRRRWASVHEGQFNAPNAFVKEII